MKYSAWGVCGWNVAIVLACLELIALIMVPAKTGWLMDVTGAAAPF